MNVFLWIIQLLLAAIFLTVGLAKAVVPMETLAKAMTWVNEYSSKKVRAIGILESLGGFGLFFPGLYPISKLIIPFSATGLAVIMVLAAYSNLQRGDRNEFISNLALLGLSLFVAISRFILYL